MNVFEEANSKFEDFIQNNLNSYHKLRNFDYGIKNRTNVSQISKYTTHRILLEYKLIEKLKKIDKKKKFTDELLWRIYWKGYLENHKSIWIDYKNIKELSYDSNLLKNAKNGKTGIDCFDKWIEELRENNYLHNHSRMWFASLWIFTLKLPWKLGASFFMKYLLDGDASSNTLSWRWVAGMHTNNKPYIASKENINKYTFYRFKDFPIELSKNTNTIKSEIHHQNKLPKYKYCSKSKILLMFDNDMNITGRSDLFNSYLKVYIIINEHIENNYRINEKVSLFKQRLIVDLNKSISNSEILHASDLDLALNDFKYIDLIYPGIGNNLDLINKYSKRNNLIFNYIYRKEDLIYWDKANSGYYKFKKSFYILNKL